MGITYKLYYINREYLMIEITFYTKYQMVIKGKEIYLCEVL